MNTTRLYRMALVVVALVAVACADETTAPTQTSALVGMTELSPGDTGVGTPPPAPTPGSIAFYGTIYGSVPHVGGDSVSAAARLVNASVKAYKVTGTFDGQGLPILGELIGSTTTDTAGVFQMNPIPNDEYIVTFTPAGTDATIWHSGWTQTTISGMSSAHPWFIFLSRK